MWGGGRLILILEQLPDGAWAVFSVRSVHAGPAYNITQGLTPEPKAKWKKMSFSPEIQNIWRLRASARKPGLKADDVKAKIFIFIFFISRASI